MKLSYNEYRGLACMGAMALGREDLAVELMHDRVELEPRNNEVPLKEDS